MPDFIETGADTLQAGVRALTEHGERPALVVLRKHDLETWSFAQLVDHAQRLATGLTEAGLERGAPALLFAPNGPEWIVACLALLAAAAVPVPVDTQMGEKDLKHVLDDSEARWIFTTSRLGHRLDAVGCRGNATRVSFDVEGDDENSWRRYLARHVRDLPSTRPDDPAVLFYTSGTTGRPKGVPLTNRNLTANTRALLDLGLIGTTDRLLLPLPLHHVYPFTVGMLAPLALGIPIVLPYSLTGPQVLRALQKGQVTGLIGVPRFYAALYAAIKAHVRQQGRIAAALFSWALAMSVALQRRLGVHLGQRVFAPLHRQFAPRLRIVASGGSALDPALAWKLEGLGWQVASGYGLTETAPILTFHPPGAGRLETVGKPLPGVDIRIARPEQHIAHVKHGEVLARGPNVFSGYRHLPEETKNVFTAEGYFRTGDLGYLDNEGYLHVVGRASALVVRPGGENIRPEDVEEALAQGEYIREAGVLDDEGRLAAVIVPEASATRQDGSPNVEELVRCDVEQHSRTLPSHHRIGDYVISVDALPRTRLGKIRRHKLGQHYQRAKQQGEQPSEDTGPVAFEHLSPEDRQLLEDQSARQVWDWLAERFPKVRLAPDTNLQFDLGIDSLEWLNLTLEIREHTGSELDQEAIGRIEMVRDLLREAAEAERVTDGGQPLLEQLHRPEELLSAQQQEWLQPPGAFVRFLGSFLFGVDRWLMRWLYRLEVRGREHLPERGPFILTPNHVSLLDPPVLVAALPKQHLPCTYWGGWTGMMFTNPFMRLVSRATRVVPVDPQRGPLSSLAFGVAAVQSEHNLVWFPEGERSRSGHLQQFRSGIGLVLRTRHVPVIPVWISGTYEALPAGKWWPRLCPLTVVFGQPLDPQDLQRSGDANRQPHERIAAALQKQVAALGGSS